MIRTCPPWVRPQLENGIETQETSMDIQIEMEARSLSDLSRQGGGPNQVRVHLGVQEQSARKSMPRSYTEPVLDVLYMDGKIISRSFQWHQSQAQILLESTGIIETIGHPESIMVLRHHLLGCWPMYRVGVHYGRG